MRGYRIRSLVGASRLSSASEGAGVEETLQSHESSARNAESARGRQTARRDPLQILARVLRWNREERQAPTRPFLPSAGY
jgi:hypothetical protein